MPFTVLRKDQNEEVVEVATTDSREAAEKTDAVAETTLAGRLLGSGIKTNGRKLTGIDEHPILHLIHGRLKNLK